MANGEDGGTNNGGAAAWCMSEVGRGKWEMKKIIDNKWLGLISREISCLALLFRELREARSAIKDQLERMMPIAALSFRGNQSTPVPWVLFLQAVGLCLKSALLTSQPNMS